MRKTLADVIYLACKDCHHAPVGEEATRRDADVEGLKQMLDGQAYSPVYFTQGAFAMKLSEFKGYDPKFLDALKSIPYVDLFAEPTQVRVEKAAAEYHKHYREARKEQLHTQYHQGGGKERAAALYQERKALLPPKIQRTPTEEELEAKRLAACEYSKLWYQRKKAAKAAVQDNSTLKGTEYD